MREAQQRTTDFRRAMGQLVGHFTDPKIQDGELCKSLIAEETKELLQAITDNDLPRAIDGICDLLYVTLGAAVAFGVDIWPFFLEVHRANMQKTTGPVREDGKRLKPPGWEPPKIDAIITLQIAVATGNLGYTTEGDHDDPAPSTE